MRVWLKPDQVHDVYRSFPETESIFQLAFPNGGFGGMVFKPWSERSKTAQQLLMEAQGPLSQVAGVRAIPLLPPPLPGGSDFPVDLVIASPAEPQQLAEMAGRLVRKAFASGVFMFADADLKFDQPQAEVVFDRDKLRSQGVDLGQAGRDLSIPLGGDYVNRFSIQGRSYKVVPQIERADRLTTDQLAQISITGSGDKLAAIAESAATRLRPILMTTAATVVGHFPLVLATGPGAGARNSIGIMLVSGMISGTIFTLFVVPSIYMLVARTRTAPVADEARERAVAGHVTTEGATA